VYTVTHILTDQEAVDLRDDLIEKYPLDVLPPPVDPDPPEPDPDPPGDVDPTRPVPRPAGLPGDVNYYSCTGWFGKELAVTNFLDQGSRDKQVNSSKFMLGIAIPALTRSKRLLITQRSTGTGPYGAVLSNESNMRPAGSLHSDTIGAGSLSYEFPAGAARIVYFSLDQKSGVNPIKINLQIILR